MEIKEEKIYRKEVHDVRVELNGKLIRLVWWNERDDTTDLDPDRGFEIRWVEGKGGKELDLTEEERNKLEAELL